MKTVLSKKRALHLTSFNLAREIWCSNWPGLDLMPISGGRVSVNTTKPYKLWVGKRWFPQRKSGWGRGGGTIQRKKEKKKERGRVGVEGERLRERERYKIKPWISTIPFWLFYFHTHCFSLLFNFKMSQSKHSLPPHKEVIQISPTYCITSYSITPRRGKLFSARSRWTRNLSPKDAYLFPTYPSGEWKR